VKAGLFDRRTIQTPGRRDDEGCRRMNTISMTLFTNSPCDRRGQNYIIRMMEAQSEGGVETMIDVRGEESEKASI
jgi:hypothetical protein